MNNLYIYKLELGFMIDEYWLWVCFQIFIHFVMSVEQSLSSLGDIPTHKYF